MACMSWLSQVVACSEKVYRVCRPSGGVSERGRRKSGQLMVRGAVYQAKENDIRSNKTEKY
jgi:hypothetical protein